MVIGSGKIINACSSLPDRIKTWLSTATIMPMAAILKIKSTSIFFSSFTASFYSTGRFIRFTVSYQHFFDRKPPLVMPLHFFMPVALSTCPMHYKYACPFHLRTCLKKKKPLRDKPSEAFNGQTALLNGNQVIFTGAKTNFFRMLQAGTPF